MKTSVIGCGRWGTFISWYLSGIGHTVTLYGRASSANLQQLLDTRKNEYLTLPEQEVLTCELADAVHADILFISVNAQGLRALCAELDRFDLSGKDLVLCMKGLEASTGLRLTEVVRATLKQNVRISVWLGPGHVEAYVKGQPNCMVIDSDDDAAKTMLVEMLSGKLIRFYYGTDLVGNEIGAASKNVIGIAAGMLDGFALCALKGALMSRGTREVSRLIGALGGNPVSAYGLCHLGDYEATVFSAHSHNRRFGECFVRGIPSTGLAEGVETARAIHHMAAQYALDMPICEAVYSILFEKADPQTKLLELFGRSRKKEF